MRNVHVKKMKCYTLSHYSEYVTHQFMWNQVGSLDTLVMVRIINEQPTSIWKAHFMEKVACNLGCWHFVGIKSPEQYTWSSESEPLASADNGRWSPIEMIWCNVTSTSTSTLLHFQPSYLNKITSNIHACMWNGCIKIRKICTNGCVHFNDKIHK